MKLSVVFVCISLMASDDGGWLQGLQLESNTSHTAHGEVYSGGSLEKNLEAEGARLGMAPSRGVN